MKLLSTKFIVIFLISGLLAACATNPVTGTPQLARSESWELSVGPQYHQQVLTQYQVYENPELQAYVNEIGQKLAAKSHRPDLNFTFTLLDSPEVNAFAVPGGYVYITRGIMAYMSRESHLAGVIGHEIGHITARHGAQRAAQQKLADVASTVVAVGTGSGELAQLSQVLGGALMSGYGRQQELQSDRLGAEYIAHNNYDPEDMIGVIGILKNQELFAQARARERGQQTQSYHGLFASHPRNDQRLQEVIKAAAQYRDVSKPKPDDGRFLALTNNMTFGESERQGITRGNRFYHKGLNLTLGFPSGWRIVNQPNQLLGIAPDGKQFIRMQTADDTQGVSLDYYLRNNFQHFREGRNLGSGERQAYAGVATINDERTGQQQYVRVGAARPGQQAFVFTGQVASENSFFDVVQSVRRLNANETKLATESKIRLITAKKGDTFARLAQQSSLTEYAEDQLRLINNMYPDGEPIVGQKIKIIN